LRLPDPNPDADSDAVAWTNSCSDSCSAKLSVGRRPLCELCGNLYGGLLLD
jgi:hypothetical protein